jgi:hypothetical protein
MMTTPTFSSLWGTFTATTLWTPGASAAPPFSTATTYTPSAVSARPLPTEKTQLGPWFAREPISYDTTVLSAVEGSEAPSSTVVATTNGCPS